MGVRSVEGFSRACLDDRSPSLPHRAVSGGPRRRRVCHCLPQLPDVVVSDGRWSRQRRGGYRQASMVDACGSAGYWRRRGRSDLQTTLHARSRRQQRHGGRRSRKRPALTAHDRLACALVLVGHRNRDVDRTRRTVDPVRGGAGRDARARHGDVPRSHACAGGSGHGRRIRRGVQHPVRRGLVRVRNDRWHRRTGSAAPGHGGNGHRHDADPGHRWPWTHLRPAIVRARIDGGDVFVRRARRAGRTRCLRIQARVGVPRAVVRAPSHAAAASSHDGRPAGRDDCRLAPGGRRKRIRTAECDPRSADAAERRRVVARCQGCRDRRRRSPPVFPAASSRRCC